MSRDSAFESAFALHAAGALADAEAAYNEILAADPRHIEALHYLGVLLHQRGETPSGLQRVLQALEIDPRSAFRYNDLGNILFQSGDLENAATAFGCAIELNGADENVWNNLGSVKHRQQELADAESAYRSALRCNPDFVPALNNLAALLGETGRDDEASLLWCRAYVQAPLGDKPAKMLGIAYYRLGRISDAAQCYREWLRVEPDNAIARHHLAACGGSDVPTRASDAYLTATFDAAADSFDEKLVGKLTYRGPEIIADLIRGTLLQEQALDVLDGGCGTGLCAPVLAPYARRLIGVDLSPRMLVKAKATNLYSELVESELTAFMQRRRCAFDLIVLADTLIYFGDLAPLLAAASASLKPGGLLALTIESAAESDAQRVDFRLDASGRYGHSWRYLVQELSAAGLVLLRADDVALRTEFCRPTPGVGVLARLPSSVQPNRPNSDKFGDDENSVETPFQGLAPFLRMSIGGKDLRLIGQEMLNRASSNANDANLWMDLATVMLCVGQRDIGMSIQTLALALKRVYHLPARQQPARLRLLMLMAPGDLTANTPLECLLEDSDIDLEMYYVCPGVPLALPIPQHDVLLVALSESEENRPFLDALGPALVAWPKPVINAPQHIPTTGRAVACTLLQDAPGLLIPPTLESCRRDLLAVADGSLALPERFSGCDFPLIVRPVGSHAGRDLDKVGNRVELAAYLDKVGGDAFFISRFIDYSGKDGLFRKCRIALIDGAPFACHMAISSNWMIHYVNAGMYEDARKRDEERDFMANFDAFAHRHRLALEAICKRTQLDYLCIDCAETKDGQLLVFEIDHAMVVHAMDPEDLFPYKKQHMLKVKNAFREFLFRLNSGQAPASVG